MALESAGFVVLPGGIGTLEEVVEVLSWANLGLFPMKTVFLDPEGYWQPLFDLLRHTVDEGFTPPALFDLALRAQTPAKALQALGL